MICKLSAAGVSVGVLLVTNRVTAPVATGSGTRNYGVYWQPTRLSCTLVSHATQSVTCLPIQMVKASYLQESVS